jgi:ribosomal protein L34E
VTLLDAVEGKADAVSKAEIERSLRRFYTKTWNGRLQHRYAHGHRVVAYLTRYVRGGPIRDRRLVSATPMTTTFSSTDHLPASASGGPHREPLDPERAGADGHTCSICGEPLTSVVDVAPERPDPPTGPCFRSASNPHSTSGPGDRAAGVVQPGDEADSGFPFPESISGRMTTEAR